MIPLGKRLRSRLVQRIYVGGLLQFVIVVAAITLLVRQARLPPVVQDTVRFVTDDLAAQSETAATLEAAVGRIHRDLHWAVAVYDAEDHLLASAGPVGEGSPFATGDLRPIGSFPLQLRGRAPGRVEFATGPAPPPPGGIATTSMLILVVVGVLSWLIARSLATPLARLAAVANAFGAGDFSARASMNRSDELGDVAKAFDQMAERITKAIRAERELLANISHELRTPLQRIRLALELAAEADSETARESLQEVSEDLSELERLLEDVLSAARLSLAEGATRASAIPPLHRERIEVRSLLEKAAGRFRGAHPERRLETKVETDASIEADAVLVRRVLENLLENAHKYSSDHRTPVVVTSRATPDSVTVEIEDQGIGIAAEDLTRVFEPFFRADRSRTRATGGVGLGLALAKRIIDAHGGRLSLESVPGQGTRARIELARA